MPERNTTVTMYREISDRYIETKDHGPIRYKRNWLQGESVSGDIDIQQMDDGYHIPGDSEYDTTDPQDYALQFTHTLLERRRPDHLPPHNGSLFMFGDTEHTMHRRYRLELDIPIDDYDIIAASWDAAQALFMATMHDFEIMHATPIDSIRERIDEYWDSAFVVTEPADVQAGYEYYIPERLPAKYITDIAVLH